jgi:hypothetical protein
VWTDPSRWPGGPIERAELHGEFAVGGTYTTKVKGFPAGTATILFVDEPRRWTSEDRSPLFTMTYEHEIEPEADGVRLTERAIIDGPLGPLVALLVGRRLARTFEATTEHCARRAESS